MVRFAAKRRGCRWFLDAGLAMPFDPCREWLGIDATDLKDPHRVLDIPPTVTDGDAIARVAEARLAALSKIAPGPFQKAHAALLMRVAEARDTLLATATWETVDEPAEEDPLATLPPPLQASIVSPVEFPMPLGVPVPGNAPVPGSALLPDIPSLAASASSPVGYQPPVLAPEYQPTEEDATPYDATPIPTASHAPLPVPSERIRTTSGGGVLGLFAIFLAIMIAGGYYAYKRFGVGQEAWDVAINTVVDPFVDLPAPHTATQAPSTEVNQPPPDLPDQEPEIPGATSSPEQHPQPPSSSPAAPPPSEPDPETERRLAEERERAAQFVNSSLQEAFDALKSEDFDKADRAIEAASQYARDDFEAGTRVERWRLLASYARGYSEFRARAFRAASSGRDYEIDGRLIVVIEVTPTQFTYRLTGRNYTVDRKTMSPVLEVGVVEAWFAGGAKAANHFYLGARWLCKEPPNLTRARTAWQKAAAGGEDAAPLMALLDDPITQEPDAR